ncbi:alpha/beta hydrolase [Nocardia sp. CC201C]|uniref:alpha/beta fold hydrolase n=1 Tax=Nocardia sp. CC201C TaxID=3044575 RepID=UPI0024AA01F7|nr:alpha/beta hydrolase [Nocardia sp. CC201C]
MARILLVPGFWLGAWAWDEVAEVLRDAGDDVTALTPRGLDPADAGRLSTTLEQQARHIVDAVPEGERRVLVLHSGAAVTGYLATDLAPERFERVIYVDTAPAWPGFAVNPGLDPALPAWELPAWDEFRAEQPNLLDGLDEAALARFRERAVSEPAPLVSVPVTLSDRPQRFAVPTTMICSSFTTEVAQQLLDAPEVSLFDELAHIDADYVDLPTGHWPMFSRPKELAELIHGTANR